VPQAEIISAATAQWRCQFLAASLLIALWPASKHYPCKGKNRWPANLALLDLAKGKIASAANFQVWLPSKSRRPASSAQRHRSMTFFWLFAVSFLPLRS